MGAPWTVKNILMMYSPKVMERCMPAMAVPAKIRQKNTVPAAWYRAKDAFSDLNAPMEAFTEKD